MATLGTDVDVSGSCTSRLQTPLFVIVMYMPCFLFYVSLNSIYCIVVSSLLACSKRLDSGERCGVEKAMKSRGGLGREVRERL